MEVVIGSFDDKVYCLRGSDGAKKWEFPTGGDVYSSPAVADCDGDGKMEVVIGSNDRKVYCLRGSDGTKKWEFTTGNTVQSSPAVADVDGDGKMEIVIGSNDKKVYCLRGSDGTQKWEFPTGGDVHTPGALVDIDGDGRFEYLVSQSNTSTLYCLNAENGSLAWQINLAVDVHSPFAGDIDGDGCSEIIVGTQGADAQGYRVFAIDDPANSTNCGTLDIGEGGFGNGFEFRALGKGIYLFMPNQAQVSLTLYDAQGRLVQKLYDGVLSSGGHTFNPTLEAKGVYMAVLRYQGGMKSLKIVR
jgi:outer membrane protein assembly factor BamB